jgi:HAD superfamily hydrolase (TIGR01509 family)
LVSWPEPFAVIFDFDGVVLDSETPEYEAHVRLFRAYGLDLTVEDWCDAIGLVDDPHRWFIRLRAVAPALEYDEYVAQKRRLFREIAAMRPIEGIGDLLDALENAGVPKAIASTATARWVHAASVEIGLAHRFAAIVTADDVARPKPAPDVYLEAARRLGVAPERCVAIEDSGPGVTAARAAGMIAVAIPHRLTRLHDLSHAHVTVEGAGALTVDTLRQLVLERPRR